MGRQPCCEDRAGLKKGPWNAEEDKKLLAFISLHGLACWREVPKLAGLRRCGKSCRLRWINYLRPDLKRGMLSPKEEDLIIQLHASYGNKWSRIASQLPGRTDNEIKNCWNTRIKKKLLGRGINPATHWPLPGMAGVTASPSAYGQTTGVKGPPCFGLPSLNAGACHHNNTKSTHRLQESLHTSPNSVMSPQVTTSLTTNHEDEFSVDYPADLLSHDRSVDSKLQASELSGEKMFRGVPHLQSSHDDNDGLKNAAYRLYACPVPIAPQEVHISSLKVPDAPYVHNPSYNMLHDTPPMHYLPHMLQSTSSILPNMQCTSPQHGALHSVEQTIIPSRASEAAVQSLQVEDGEDIPSKSNRIDETSDLCHGCRLKVDVNKENSEYARMPTYYRKAPSSSSFARPFTCPPQVGGKSQAFHDSCETKNEGITSTSFSSTQGGQWTGTTSGALFSEEGDAELEPDAVMRTLLFPYEPGQALGPHNIAAPCNTVNNNNMGQYWSSMDYLWGDPISFSD